MVRTLFYILEIEQFKCRKDENSEQIMEHKSETELAIKQEPEDETESTDDASGINCSETISCRQTYINESLSDMCRSHQCTICPKSFGNAYGLTVHMKTVHSDDRKFRCPYCEKTYKTSSVLKTHIRAMHGPPELKKPHKCGECNKGFTNVTLLRDHQLLHNSGCFVCEICNKEYLNRYSLIRHFKLDHDEVSKKHCCTLCPKRFVSPSSLKRHLYHHSGERPFQCKMCSKSFNDKSNLVNHMKIHSPVKNH